MKDARIISVNPASTAPGDANSGIIQTLARSYRKSARFARLMGLKSLIDALFGINKTVSEVWSTKLLFIRLLIGAFFITVALTNGVNFSVLSLWNIQLVVGILLIIGFFCRIAALTGLAACVSVMLMQTSVMLAPDISQVLTPLLHSPLMIQSLLFASVAIIGPGRFSIDQLIRHLLLSHLSSRIQ